MNESEKKKEEAHRALLFLSQKIKYPHPNPIVVGKHEQSSGIFLALLLASVSASACLGPPSVPNPESLPNTVILHSSAFHTEREIPSRYTCEGENRSPPLSISNFPGGSKTFALTLTDPDAPGGTFTHWMFWDLEIVRGEIPEKVDMQAFGAQEGLNDFGEQGYAGPCPPSGTHRYSFKVFALDSKLALGNDTSRSQLEEAMKGHVVAWGQLLGTSTKH